ncbi:MAG: glycosyl transferase family 1 [Anaerolinea sp.]|nr:glycosyl transferase family 1 [Anaerolinea sp.]
MRVLHIITCLNDGGAEAILYRLCSYDKANTHLVISLMHDGKYGPLLRDAGIDVHCLNITKTKVSPFALLRLYRLIKSFNPDAVQTWMYHADLIGGSIARSAGYKNINWGIHNSTLDPKQSKRTTILIAGLCAKASWIVPKRVVCCAQKSLDVHKALGYAHKKLIVVNNGYDLSKFFKDDRLGNHVRQELHLGADVPLLGMVGRFDPQKDHFNLIAALAIVKKTLPQVRCLLIGSGMNLDNAALLKCIAENDVEDQVILLNQRSDIPAIMNALDLHVLSSAYGEAFPNVLNEAMACGTPCVTTDVGDSALIVAETGWVVPPKDAQGLAASILNALQEKKNAPEKWASRQLMARRRVQENFSIETMVAGYQAVWSE